VKTEAKNVSAPAKEEEEETIVAESEASVAMGIPPTTTEVERLQGVVTRQKHKIGNLTNKLNTTLEELQKEQLRRRLAEARSEAISTRMKLRESSLAKREREAERAEIAAKKDKKEAKEYRKLVLADRLKEEKAAHHADIARGAATHVLKVANKVAALKAAIDATGPTGLAMLTSGASGNGGTAMEIASQLGMTLTSGGTGISGMTGAGPTPDGVRQARQIVDVLTPMAGKEEAKRLVREAGLKTTGSTGTASLEEVRRMGDVITAKNAYHQSIIAEAHGDVEGALKYMQKAYDTHPKGHNKWATTDEMERAARIHAAEWSMARAQKPGKNQVNPEEENPEMMPEYE
jgi:hypothetical protein